MLSQTPGCPPEALDVYQNARKQLFNRICLRREILRRIFFGHGKHEQGIVPRLFKVYQDNPQIDSQTLIAQAAISVRQKAFFERNPFLIPALVSEIVARKFISFEDLRVFIEETIPYLFAKPQAQEPSYEMKADFSNYPDVSYIYYARDYILRYLANLQKRGEMHIPPTSELYRLLKTSRLSSEYKDSKIKLDKSFLSVIRLLAIRSILNDEFLEAIKKP